MKNPSRGEPAGASISAQNQPSIDTRSQPQSQELRRLPRERLGARVIFELVDELDRHHGLGDDLDRRLQRYAALAPDLLAALGAGRFPAAPLRVVGSGR